MVTSYPRGQGCNSHLHYCSGQPIFWSYLFFRSKEEDQMRAARGMPAFVQERVLVSLEGEKASSYGGLKEQRISLFFFVLVEPLRGTWESNQSIMYENPSLGQREVAFVAEFRVCGFLDFVAKSHTARFFCVNVSVPFPLREVKKEKAWITPFPFHWIWSSGADRWLIPQLIQYGTEQEEYGCIWLFS